MARVARGGLTIQESFYRFLLQQFRGAAGANQAARTTAALGRTAGGIARASLGVRISSSLIRLGEAAGTASGPLRLLGGPLSRLGGVVFRLIPLFEMMGRFVPGLNLILGAIEAIRMTMNFFKFSGQGATGGQAAAAATLGEKGIGVGRGAWEGAGRGAAIGGIVGTALAVPTMGASLIAGPLIGAAIGGGLGAWRGSQERESWQTRRVNDAIIPARGANEDTIIMTKTPVIEGSTATATAGLITKDMTINLRINIMDEVEKKMKILANEVVQLKIHKGEVAMGRNAA